MSEYLVSRTNSWNDDKPADECYQRQYAKLDIRTFKSFEEYDNKFRDKFEDIGMEHCINADGNIQRLFVEKGWFIRLNTLKELNNFIEKYGRIVIEPSWDNKSILEIEIYDSYRE